MYRADRRDLEDRRRAAGQVGWRRPKSLVVTFLTGSLKVTVQWIRPAFVGEGSVFVSEVSVGAVVSTTHVYDAAELDLPPETACTWNVCDPLASPEYAFGETQAEYELPSSEHWNVTPDCESLNVKLIDVDVVGEVEGVLPVIVGAGGAAAANAVYAPHDPNARTPSNATSPTGPALLPVLIETHRPI